MDLCVALRKLQQEGQSLPFFVQARFEPRGGGLGPDELAMEAGVDLRRGHNHDLPTPGSKKHQSAGYIDPFVKEVVAAAVKTGIPTGKTSALSLTWVSR